MVDDVDLDGDPEMPPTPIVFLVEDDPTVSDSLQFLMESAGHEVRAYDTIEGFEKAFEPSAPGCLIVDLHLPDGSGFDVLHALRERRCDIPVLFVTGRASVPKAVRAIKMGAVEFLEKPVDHAQLLEKAEEAIATDRAAWRGRRRIERIRQRLTKLTSREKEVLDLVVVGNKTGQVASQLEITVKTVERHRGSIMDKMEVPNVSTLVHDFMLAKYGGNGSDESKREE